MKKSELFKMAVDENIADKDLILNNILNSDMGGDTLKSSRRKGIIKLSYRVAAALLIIAVVSFSIWNMPLNPDTTKYAEGTKPNSRAVVKQNSGFMLVVYAAEKDSTNTHTGIKVDTGTKTELKPNIKVMAPSGRIDRGNNDSSDGYSVSYEGFGLTCTGEDIKSVIYTSENGSFNYFDALLLKQMESKGELYICRIPISKDIINPEMGYDEVKKVFNSLWSSGSLDEYKNKYFGGKDINLDDYQISFHSTRDYTVPGNTGEETYMEISQKADGLPPYILQGPEVKAIPGDVVEWSPLKAMDILDKDFNVPYEDLPGDTITVTAEYNNGDIESKKVVLSFDKDGNTMVELEEK